LALIVFRSPFDSFLAAIVLAEARHTIIVPLLILCALVVIAIPIAASRGKLHMPGYAGLALLALVVGLLLGRMGTHAAKGSGTAVVLSAIFFILIAIAIGSVLALACYRERPAPETQSKDAAQ
jgi:hypothetical protein